MAYRALDSGAAVLAPAQTTRYNYTKQSFEHFRAFADGTQGWGNTPGWVPDSGPAVPPSLKNVSPEEAARRRAIVSQFGTSGWGDEGYELTNSPDYSLLSPQDTGERRLTIDEYSPLRREIAKALKSERCRKFIDTLVTYVSGQQMDSQDKFLALSDYMFNQPTGGIFWGPFNKDSTVLNHRTKILISGGAIRPDLNVRRNAETLMHELIHVVQGRGSDDTLDNALRDLGIVPKDSKGQPLPFPTGMRDGKRYNDWSDYWDQALKNACFP
jgi:hypothetical protein